MKRKAYAKLNLTLDILRKREDGYHDMSMVMQSISLCDDVTVEVREGTDIVCLCGDLPGDERNLAVKAAKKFFDESGCKAEGLYIKIDKHIPMQAGMAGGSTDAAAVLHALRELLTPDMPLSELERIGALVGSDVPYCVRGGTALAEGRGEELTTLFAAPKLYVVVCKPDFAISTPMLFSRVRVGELKTRPDTGAMLDAIAHGDTDALCRNVRNVFEEVLPEEYAAEIERIKSSLRALGAEAAAMTGSGSATFGLFRESESAQRATAELQKTYRETFFCEFV